MSAECSEMSSAILGLGMGFLVLIVILAIVDTVLKFMAMWKAARAGSLGWFVCLGIFNTLGILPLIYILFIAKKNNTDIVQ